MYDDDGRQVMTIAHLTLWVRWAKNVMARTRKYYLKKQLFDLEVKGQGPMKVITACNTQPYGYEPTYQI
jgi:hypothetical protein